MASFWMLLLAISFFPIQCESKCRGCELALASYYVTDGENMAGIASLFGIAFSEIGTSILPYNKKILSADNLLVGRINVPFRCDCIGGEFLGQVFRYVATSEDTYETIAKDVYHNLTTEAFLKETNSYDELRIPVDAAINVTVKCFCGDEKLSRDYGVFLTYPLRPGDSLESVAGEVGLSDLNLLQMYNPDVSFSAGEGIVYVPHNDSNGSFRPLNRTVKLHPAVIAAISVASFAFLVVSLFVWIYHGENKRKRGILLSPSGSVRAADNVSGKPIAQTNSLCLENHKGKIAKYSYKDLAEATNNFNLACKIGEGGFASVYYAEIEGKKVAIKKMAMQATKEFLAELNVLSNTHHTNLVSLMGYCIERSLFLIYEYMENGNLRKCLNSSLGKKLTWTTRVKIALDSASGLLYIHDHTAQLYIHCDIKSANILLDKHLNAKVADFGLAKLPKCGDPSLQSKVGGTIGYMSPEYALGVLSPKVDVYAFGIVLYELISGKPAIVRMKELPLESRGIIDLFEDVFSHPDPKTELPKLVDPNLGNDYPIDMVYQMAQLARLCTHEEAHCRPNMGKVVVALVTLSSSTALWDTDLLLRNPSFLNLASGR